MPLPQIAQLEFDSVDSPSTSSANGTVHKTLDWDFDTGDFRLVDGKFVELSSVAYLKVWIQKALRTIRDSSIYANTGYGSEHHLLAGNEFKSGFMKSEYERLIQEALLQNGAITQIDNFSFSQEGSRLIITFNVDSIYGKTSQAVKV